MAQNGVLVQWNDARGFGFIEDDKGRRHFVHISVIERIATRPRVGDSVSFIPALGSDGRAQAKAVRILGANPVGMERRQRTSASTRSDWRIAAALLLTLVLAFGALTGRTPIPLVLVYGGMGVLSFLAYRSDKVFARTRQWRISEITLLGMDLCLGIIGGLLGQAIFRHKTQKSEFAAATLLIFAVHAIWLLCFATGFINAYRVLPTIMEIVAVGG